MVEAVNQDIVVTMRAIIDKSMLGVQKVIEHIGAQTKMAGNRIYAFGEKMDESARKTKKFNYGLLSTLFLGMQLMKTTNALLSPAFEAAGVFEVWGAILKLLFLPTALDILDWSIKMLDIVQKMPDDIKKLIGSIVVLISIIGPLLMVLSQLGLVNFAPLGASILLFVGNAITAILAFFETIGIIIAGVASSIGVPFIAVAAAIVIVLASILFNIKGWVEAFTNLISNFINSITDIFEGGWKMIQGVIDFILGIIEGIFTNHSDKIGKGISKFIDGCVQLFGGLFDLLVGNWLKFGGDIIKAFADGITNAWGFVRSAIAGIPIIGPMLAGGMDIVSGIASMITSAIGSAIGGVGSAVTGLLHNLHIPGFAEGGIITKPTFAMVGEKGPEAIVPLTGNTALGINEIVSGIKDSLSSFLNNLKVPVEVVYGASANMINNNNINTESTGTILDAIKNSTSSISSAVSDGIYFISKSIDTSLKNIVSTLPSGNVGAVAQPSLAMNNDIKPESIVNMTNNSNVYNNGQDNISVYNTFNNTVSSDLDITSIANQVDRTLYDRYSGVRLA